MSTSTDGKQLGLMFDDFTQVAPTPHAPFELFEIWMKDAEASEPNDPNAMSVATVDEGGMPNVRILLLKGHDERGFVFYSNFESQKGRELLGAGKAALNFHWKTLGRQIRIRGPIEQVSDTEADAYYNSRPEGSRIGAWASQQSRPLDSRATLEEAVAAYEKRYEGQPIPRPTHWSGFRLRPLSIEFWQAGDFRLHNRIVFTRQHIDVLEWAKQRLYP